MSTGFLIMLWSLVGSAVVLPGCCAAAMPAPFTRELYVTDPYMTGTDVFIAKSLLSRVPGVDTTFSITDEFASGSAVATSISQVVNNLPSTGIFDNITAQTLLNLYADDGYSDSGFAAASMGYLYKIYVPVHRNRSVETCSTLYDANNNVMLEFKTRAHGLRAGGVRSPLPDFGNGDVGLNQFAINGNTVTGLVELDLNSPEPDTSFYGPWPVNRFVRGLLGNALLLVPEIRDDIFLHTGIWSTSRNNWEATSDMPNSSGGIHAHPSDIERIWMILVDLGVEVRDNPYTGKNYPYKPQGVGVIELID